MASPLTHFAAFLLLFPTGLRRLFSSSSLFLSNPSLFRSKLWYFPSSSSPAADLCFLLIALPISSSSHLLLFLSSSGPASFRFSFSHQSLLLFFFWAFLLLILLKQHINVDLLSIIDDTLLFVLVGIVFLLDFAFTGNGVSTLSIAGTTYGLLGKLSFLCALCCFFLAVKPAAFWAEFVLSCGLVFKGTWSLQAGLSLGVDAFVPMGCQKLRAVLGEDIIADAKCDLQEDGLRGVAMINLLFIGHTILVFVVGIVLYWVSWLCNSNRCSRFGDANGPLLGQLEPDIAPVRQPTGV